jgi:hypothetical protein
MSEVNHPWWSQSGICFEMQEITHDMLLVNGIDI